MLLELHVRNLALIERADVEFGEGLNILTGETGSGKSIFMGSVNMALGGKVPRDMVRKGAEYAYIELIFSVDRDKAAILREMGVSPDEDGTLIISRKILPSRSVSRINDETVTTAKLRAVTGLLLDMHGQHEHQSLLHKQKHLEILDEYSRNETEKLKIDTAACYANYRELEQKLEHFSMDEESRKREMDFLRFEIGEIENAGLKPGEEETLAAVCRKFSNSQRIMESLTDAYQAVDGDRISRALRQAESVLAYDEGISGIVEGLRDAESILSDLSRSISDYLNGMDFSEAELRTAENRLDTIRGLTAKYGGTEEAVLESLKQKKERLSELENFEELAGEAEREYEEAKMALERACQQLSAARKEAAAGLEKRIREELLDLNFLHVDFRIQVRKLDRFTEQGFDEVEFLISTNPGSIPPRPLGEVASGGELSRIMLAIKTVLADTDKIPTLIFDEIDTGISGRTAQKVSERLSYIASRHQVLCITHLPQIAAMADTHFEIKKEVEDEKTVTRIRRNAREMKRLAALAKEKGKIPAKN